MQALLQREIGQGIEVERLLTRDRYARDVLLVCDACAGSELPQLAAEFRRLTPGMRGGPPPLPTASPGHAAQATEWSGDTSGFGVSRPPEVRLPTTPTAQAARPGWRARLPWR